MGIFLFVDILDVWYRIMLPVISFGQFPFLRNNPVWVIDCWGFVIGQCINRFILMLVSTWLMQVKTMRALQYFPTIEDPNTRRSLFEVLLLLKDFFFFWSCFFDYIKIWFRNFQVLQRILMGTDVVKNVNKNNASHAVLFEALALVSLWPKKSF